MSISNYGELKDAVERFIDRADLSSVVPDFVALAEVDIRTDVRVAAMEQFATGTLTGETLAHPSGYLWARVLRVGTRPYTYNEPGVYLEKRDRSSTERVFTSIGQSLYILNGASGDAYSLVYYEAFDAFSSATDTNWLLTSHPNVYLWASAKYSAIYREDDTAAGRYATLYQDAVGRLTSREASQASSGGPLVIKTSAVE